MKKAADKAPTTKPGGDKNEVASLGRFASALFDLGWRLAIVVVGFLWFGNWLDRRYGTRPVFALIGFGLIVVSFIVIVRQVLSNIPHSQGGLKKDD